MDNAEFVKKFIQAGKTAFVKKVLDVAWEAGMKPALLLMVHEDDTKTSVPTNFVKDGKISLIMGAADIRNYHFDEDEGVISFTASFGGRPMDVVISVGAIICMYVDHQPIPANFPVWAHVPSGAVEPKKHERKEEPQVTDNVVSLFKAGTTRH